MRGSPIHERVPVCRDWTTLKGSNSTVTFLLSMSSLNLDSGTIL